MSTRKNTQSALRASLKQEDAALTERLPAAEAATPAAAPAAATVHVGSGEERVTVAPPAAAQTTVARTAAPVKKASAAKTAAAKPAARPATKKAATVVKTARPAAAPGKAAASAAAKAAMPVAAPAVQASKPIIIESESGKKDKREKVMRDSFSLPASEHKRIKALREALGQSGRLASKSEVLRAGLALLSQRSTTEVVSLLDALPPVAKGKRSKKA
jgi:hypothetical protein